MNYATDFDEEVLTHSERGEAAGIDNTIPVEFTPNLIRLSNYLQGVQDLLNIYRPGKRIHVNSGYRSPDVNALVGGSKNPPSAHMQGRAADCVVKGMTPREFSDFVEVYCDGYDKLIIEFDAWVHIQIAKDGETPHHTTWVARRDVHGKTEYVPKTASVPG